jgi:signal transduction histidine kinase
LKPPASHNSNLLLDDAVLDDKVAVDQIEFYCRDLPPTLFSSLLLSIGMTFFFWGRESSPALLVWLIYQLLVTYFRFSVCRAVAARGAGRLNVDYWLARLQSGSFLAGAGWGVGNVVLYQDIPLEYKILVACTLPAICGVTASTMAILPRTFPVFLLPIMVPFLLVNVAPGSTLGYGLTLFGVLFIAILLVTSKRNYENMKESLRLNHQNRILRECADAASHAKSEFLSSVSHELRTPMTSVYGFAKVIKKKLDRHIFPLVDAHDARAQREIQHVRTDLDVIVSEGERLTSLINNVLDLAKLEAGRVEWHFADVDMSGSIEHAAATIRPLTESRRLYLKLEVEQGLPCVRGDRDRLVQVLINLGSNAVKFTERGGITFSARRQENGIVVSVADTGIGIASENCARVFDKFHQIGDTLTDKPAGTGLGLSICKEIIDRHGGRIWVESEPGKGSEFKFTLPVE